MNAIDPSQVPAMRRACQAPVSAIDALPPDEVALSVLIARVAAAQDRQAFAALYKYFAPRLKSFLMRGGLGVAQAEELTQEVMLTIWRKAGQYDPDRANAATWVFTIARNARIDLARRQRDLPPEPEEDHAASAESFYLEAERNALVRRALSRLSAEQLSIVQLSFYADTPHAAIATALNLPLGTVKSRIRLAMARLRTLLGEMP